MRQPVVNVVRPSKGNQEIHVEESDDRLFRSAWAKLLAAQEA